MDAKSKKTLTETDIRTKFITLVIVGEGGAGWGLSTRNKHSASVLKGSGRGGW